MNNPTLLGIAAGLVLASNGYAAIINVPGDELAIQAGIDAAVDFDEVVVAVATYNEAIDFLGKRIPGRFQRRMQSSGSRATCCNKVLSAPGRRRDGESTGGVVGGTGDATADPAGPAID